MSTKKNSLWHSKQNFYEEKTFFYNNATMHSRQLFLNSDKTTTV